MKGKNNFIKEYKAVYYDYFVCNFRDADPSEYMFGAVYAMERVAENVFHIDTERLEARWYKEFRKEVK